MLYENKYVISFHSNTDKGPDYWKPPDNSAVQLAAAITAYARIYMYPYISREDSYYTDTDSVVLGQPIPDEEVSPSSLGKFKLEDFILEGYFLAPKSYYYKTKEKKDVLKFKGPLKDHVRKDIFNTLYLNPDTKIPVKNLRKFKVNIKDLTVREEERIETLGIKLGNKRNPVFRSGDWVDSEPIDIEDLSSLNYIGKRVFKSLKKRLNEMKEERCKEMK